MKNQDGQVLGVTSDVLVQLPSGRIVFVLVKPTELYSEPKALPPSVLSAPGPGKAPLQCTLTFDQWLNSPHLDWDPKLVVKDSANGAQMYAYYQQRWLESVPTPPTQGTNVVAPAKDAPMPTRFVSLTNLRMLRVAAPAWDAPGFLTGFLLDWPNGRVTHALVSPVFDPLPKPGEKWFAIPVAMLNPPVQDESLTVNAPAEAIARAKEWVESQPMSVAANEILLFPASADPDSTASKPAATE